MNAARYTSNLQKGGALLGPSALFVVSWDQDRSIAENLAEMVEANKLGLASSTRRRDLVGRIMKPRFVDPGPHIIPALKELLKQNHHAFSDACYFETCRTELLLSNFAGGPVFDWYAAGRSMITVDDVIGWLDSATQEAPAQWSEAVRLRLSQALLAALRDFGVLKGATKGSKKQIASPYPSIAGFAYACWRLHEMGVTAASLEASPAWRQWLLTPGDVSTLMIDLARQGVILLNRAGSVTRIEWQATSLVEAVHGAA
ncbi:MAG: BrxA family protein [Actinomycetota bacterium]